MRRLSRDATIWRGILGITQDAPLSGNHAAVPRIHKQRTTAKWIEPCGNDFVASPANKAICLTCGWSRKKHVCSCGCGLGEHIK